MVALLLAIGLLLASSSWALEPGVDGFPGQDAIQVLPIPQAVAVRGTPLVASPKSTALNTVAQRLAAGLEAVRAQGTGAAPPSPGLPRTPFPQTLLPTVKSKAQTITPKSTGGLSSALGAEAPALAWRLTSRGTPRHLAARDGGPLAAAPPLVLKAAQREPAAARAFFSAYHHHLGLADPVGELRLAKRIEDPVTGGVTLRYDQVYGDLPVWPAQLNLHLDAAGAVQLLNGVYAPTPILDTTPTLDADRAVDAARTHLRAKGRTFLPAEALEVLEEPRLIVYAPLQPTPPRLAWQLLIQTGFSQRWLVAVDAVDGAVLSAFNTVPTQTQTGSGTDLQGLTRSFGTWGENGVFYLIDTTKPMFDPSSDPPQPNTTRGAIFVLDARNQPPTDNVRFTPQAFFVTAPAPTGPWLPDAVSAVAHFSATYDYFLQRHGRNSIDDGGLSIQAVVRVGQNFFNAFWLADQATMYFGDAAPFADALDVLAHELTHGVTTYSANLIYQDQSGALNESFSDVFGEMVEARTTGATDWLVGSVLGEDHLRNMRDPNARAIGNTGRVYPAHMDEFFPPTDPIAANDNGGVHINSSIINRAFYLLAEGLPNAVGLADAEGIFYRMLTVHLTQNSQFIDARLAALQSARELFGDNAPQVAAVDAAFAQVGLADDIAPSPDPLPLPTIDGEDAVMFSYSGGGGLNLGRREPALGDGNFGVDPFGSTVGVRPARIGVTGDGQAGIFVAPDNDLCVFSTNGAFLDCLGLPGLASSVAISRDGTRVGYVPLVNGTPINAIAVLDIDGDSNDQTNQYTLVAPTFTEGLTVNSIVRADDLDFSNDKRLLVYDALNELTLEDGSRTQVWSIYAIDLNTGNTLTLIPPVAGLDIGYPAMGQTRDDLMAFDAVDPATGVTRVYVANFSTGSLAPLAEFDGRFSVPSFSGDDRALIFSGPDAATATGTSLIRVALSEDRLSRVGEFVTWLADADFGTVYRRADFDSPDALFNLSTNGFVSGTEGLVAGLIVKGAPQRFVIYGENAIPGASSGLQDPVLRLTDAFSGALVEANDDWRTHPTASEVVASTGRGPTSILDAAFAVTLPQGVYLAQLTDFSSRSGQGLLSIQKNQTGASGLINNSTNGFVGPQGMVAGFIVNPGPSQRYGIVAETVGSGGVGDPVLVLGRVVDENGNAVDEVVDVNDDWPNHPSASELVTALQRQPGSNLDAGFLVSLPPGVYLAEVTGFNGAQGFGVVAVNAVDEF
ncbi:MAG: M4 family metallopeptidase [Candidatus Competibacterales bacterium]